MNLTRRIKALDLVIAALAILFLGASSISHAGPLDNYGENKVLDALMRGQAIGTPANWYLGLNTDTCTEGAAGTEVSTSSTGYARQAVAASLAAWAGTQGAGTTVASTGTGGSTSNNATISFGPSTAAWGTIQSITFNDAASAGNRWICINLSASIPVSASGYTITFTAGQLQFQIDN
jgi:hypothetical protein